MQNIISTAIENISETDISEFWWSKPSFKAAYGEDYHAFELFGTVHIIWLVIAVVTWILGSLLYRKLDDRGRSTTLKAIALFALVFEIVMNIVYAVTNQWDFDVLPLHLCGINIFVLLFYAFKPNDLTANFLYAVCLPGALFALITPAWQVQPMANFFHIHSEILHILLVLFPIMLIADGFKPNWRSLWKLFLVTLAIAVPMYFVNIALGTNFFFVNRTDNIGTFELLGSIFPDYRIGLLVLIAVLWLAMYLPWIIIEKAKKNKEA